MTVNPRDWKSPYKTGYKYATQAYHWAKPYAQSAYNFQQKHGQQLVDAIQVGKDIQQGDDFDGRLGQSVYFDADDGFF